MREDGGKSPDAGERSTGRAIVRALTLLKDQPRLVTFAVLTSVGTAAVGLLLPWLFGQAVGAVQDRDEAVVVRFGVALAGAGLVLAALTGANRLVTGRLAVEVEVELRNRLFSHYLELDADYQAREGVGQQVSRLMVTSGPLRNFLAFSLPKIVNDGITFVLAGLAIALTAPLLSLAVVWPVPIVVWFIVRYATVVTPQMRRRQVLEAEVTGVAEQTLRGALTLDVLGSSDRMVDEFDARTGAWLDMSRTVARATAWYDSAIQYLPYLAWPGLFFFGGRAVVDGRLELHQFVTFSGYVAVMLSPLTAFGGQLWTAQRAAASSQRVFEVLDEVPSVRTAPDARPLVDVAGHVAAHGVTKSFDGRSTALEAVELEVAAGRNVVLVGPTGSGKSALLSLVARSHDPERGTIVVDGTPIDGVHLASLRATVHRIGDSPHLFPMSVRDNLLYGAPHARPEWVARVTEQLGLDDVVRRLPDGYDTVVGDGGLELSDAVAQLVSIGRTFVAEPRVVLLDDVTAPFPPDLERRVIDGLAALTADCTVVAVANRPALLRLADHIVVFESGQVVDQGTSEELAARNPVFAELLRAWHVGSAHTAGRAEGSPR